MKAARVILCALDRAGPHYLALIGAGVFGIWFPAPSLQASTSPVAFWFWIGSLILGGTLCSIGRWIDRPQPAVVGLSLVLITLATFIIAIASRWPETSSSVCFMISVFSTFAYRLYHKVKTRDARTAVRRGNPTGPDLATYALDRLAGSRSNRGGSVDRSLRSSAAARAAELWHGHHHPHGRTGSDG